MTNDDLQELFRRVDVDGGGEIDANEFVQWLFRPPGSQRKRVMAHQSSAATEKTSAVTRLKRRFKEASASMTEDIGWDLVFDKYLLLLNDVISLIYQHLHCCVTVADQQMNSLVQVR